MRAGVFLIFLQARDIAKQQFVKIIWKSHATCFCGLLISALYFFQFLVMMSVYSASHSNSIFTAGKVFSVITMIPIFELQIKRLHFINEIDFKHL